ncbi:hypothetical protein SAMN02983003_2609 [Devosia enhydra]|uniref:DUF3299 domain-containing protein n=1 Tax=Devosia enhydra TaxID=665118 RepID=A0A1K2I0Y4_9HYPH|nr:DUF3299 domain-containing protein [Devosia enhydra]SFZ85444.1 hypothetical protein SAMN02983003_2609 [Devosia enhydra]
MLKPLAATAFLSVTLLASLAILANPALADPMQLGWEDLLPDGGDVARPVALTEHDETGLALRLNDGDVPIREDLDGLEVRITGYVTPVSFVPGSRASRVGTFLLAPFTGVCVHVPPPPANQLVLAEFPEGIQLATRLSVDPVIVIGTLRAEKASVDVTTAGYTIEATSVEFLNDTNSSRMNRFFWGTN